MVFPWRGGEDEDFAPCDLCASVCVSKCWAADEAAGYEAGDCGAQALSDDDAGGGMKLSLKAGEQLRIEFQGGARPRIYTDTDGTVHVTALPADDRLADGVFVGESGVRVMLGPEISREG
jgi:hypothetical protein